MAFDDAEDGRRRHTPDDERARERASYRRWIVFVSFRFVSFRFDAPRRDATGDKKKS